MKKLLAGGVSGAAALALIFGAGPASADNELKGLTFAEAQERAGGNAVVASRTGSYLPTEECIVTGNRRASFGNGNSKVLVDLNCNDTMTAGHPGYSVTTEQGKKAEQMRGWGRQYTQNYEAAIEAGEVPFCAANEFNVNKCLDICKRAGTCSQELIDYLRGL